MTAQGFEIVATRPQAHNDHAVMQTDKRCGLVDIKHAQFDRETRPQAHNDRTVEPLKFCNLAWYEGTWLWAGVPKKEVWIAQYQVKATDFKSPKKWMSNIFWIVEAFVIKFGRVSDAVSRARELNKTVWKEISKVKGTVRISTSSERVFVHSLSFEPVFGDQTLWTSRYWSSLLGFWF